MVIKMVIEKASEEDAKKTSENIDKFLAGKLPNRPLNPKEEKLSKEIKEKSYIEEIGEELKEDYKKKHPEIQNPEDKKLSKEIKKEEIEKINKEDVEKYYKFLNHSEETELRVCDPNKIKLPISIFCKNVSEFIEGCEKWNGIWNIYAGMNERVSGGKSDKDVKFITNIGHDIDAHKTGRMDIASQIALQIKEDCIKSGYKEPLIICSGWGFWVIHHISPIENTPENERKIKEFGDRTIQRYSREEIDIDSVVYNPSRISRVAGTLNLREKQNPIRSFIANNPSNEEDTKLADDILAIEIKTAFSTNLTTTSKGNCAFMDYCLTHEIPKGERHSIISRNMSLYICDNPNRELLKQQYSKIQKGSDTELDQWLKNADIDGKDKYPFSCGELINFQKKYKIALKCRGCLRFREFIKSKKEEEKSKEINVIEDNADYSALQRNVLTQIALDERRSATEMMVREIEKNNHIYTIRHDEKPEMWIYTDGIYKPEGKTLVREILRQILGEAFTSHLCNEVIIKIEADTYINAKDFFSQIYLNEIPVLNGILNLETRELSPFNPKKIFFNKLPVIYDPTAICLKIDQFLKDVLANEEDKLVFYEMGGFCLLSEYKYEKAFMLVGNGRNGKDKAEELIKRLVGVENCCSVPLSSLSMDSFIIAEFFGKKVNLSGEISNKDLKDTNTFKALTGRSLISAQRKFLTPITFQNSAKFIFACNDLPMVYDSSKGFWDRWVLLEFPYTFVPEEELKANPINKTLKLRDVSIIEKITTPEELSGLLNEFLDGLDRLNEKKNFSSAKGSEEVKLLWIRKSNSFTAFCMDYIEDGYNSFITKKELRKRYSEYCIKHRISVKSDFVIKDILQELFGVSEERLERAEFGYERPFVWTGIKWKNLNKL